MYNRTQHYDSIQLSLRALGKCNDPTANSESPDLFIFWGGETRRGSKSSGELTLQRAEAVVLIATR